jgi:hypothetical protein
MATRRLVKAEQEIHHGCFATARAPHDGNLGARIYVKGKLVEDWPPVNIGEIHSMKGNIAHQSAGGFVARLVAGSDVFSLDYVYLDGMVERISPRRVRLAKLC